MGRILLNSAGILLSILPELITNKKGNKKRDKDISQMKVDIQMLFKKAKFFLKIEIFIVALVLVLIVANSFYIHTINTRLDKIENTQARFETDITLKLDQLLVNRKPER